MLLASVDLMFHDLKWPKDPRDLNQDAPARNYSSTILIFRFRARGVRSHTTSLGSCRVLEIGPQLCVARPLESYKMDFPRSLHLKHLPYLVGLVLLALAERVVSSDETACVLRAGKTTPTTTADVVTTAAISGILQRKLNPLLDLYIVASCGCGSMPPDMTRMLYFEIEVCVVLRWQTQWCDI
jgi:hypothetical protein